MGAQGLAVISARSRIHHKTLAGNLLFYVPLIALIICGFAFKDADKRIHTAIRIAAVVIILLSYAVDLLLSH